MKAIIIAAFILNTLTAQQIASDFVIAQQTCGAFQIGHDFIEKAIGKMVDQYLDRYNQVPKASHESIKKGLTFDQVKQNDGIELSLEKHKHASLSVLGPR